jgi:hypothetical protein
MKSNVGSTGDIEVVTPHDTTALRTGDNGYEKPTRAVFIGAAGNINVITASGQTVLITAPAVGVWHPIAVTHIKSTSTTATPILAGW